MAQIKTHYSGWKEVEQKIALDYAKHLYNSLTCRNRLNYINTEMLKGISFAEEQLIEKNNTLKIERLPKERMQIYKNIKQEKGKTLDEMTKEEKKEYELLLNKMAREEMKLKLLADINMNFIICQFTGENPKLYLMELKEIIDDTLNKLEGRG
jgi:hypothetical protein